MSRLIGSFEHLFPFLFESYSTRVIGNRRISGLYLFISSSCCSAKAKNTKMARNCKFHKSFFERDACLAKTHCYLVSSVGRLFLTTLDSNQSKLQSKLLSCCRRSAIEPVLTFNNNFLIQLKSIFFFEGEVFSQISVWWVISKPTTFSDFLLIL